MSEGMRAVAIACLVMCVSVCGPAPLLAHDVPPSPSSDSQPLKVWAQVGIDADLDERWRATVRVGHLGGLDSGILLTELTFVAGNPLQILAGYVRVQPTTTDRSATSVLRAGGVWLPLRGRVALDNRLLIERRSGQTQRVSARGRNRLRISWSPGDERLLRVFASVETFVATIDGVVERRYQAGATRSVGRAALEIYWLQSRSRFRPEFNAVGVTAFWRLGTE